jgi:hypothetical protein
MQNDMKVLAANIENLARDVQKKLDSSVNSNDELINVANELVRNNITFVFALGEFYGKSSTVKTVKAPKVKTTTATNTGSHSYHNLRDSLGRFARKV